MTRHFNQQLFHGAGDHSKMGVRKLRSVLNNALNMQSGMQQGVHQTDPQYKEGQRVLEDAVRDIAAALLGRSVTFGKKLPYDNEIRIQRTQT